MILRKSKYYRERTPYPYQHDTLELMLENDAKRESRCEFKHYHGLFFQMRLGKCLTALRYCREKGYTHNLIIAPLSIIGPTWEEELFNRERLSCFKFTNDNLSVGYKHSQYPGNVYSFQETHDIWHLPNVNVVVNPDFLRYKEDGHGTLFPSERCRSITEVDWDCIIYDESHSLASPINKITRFCTDEKANFLRAKSKMILAGNPTPNSLLEYFNQIKFLKGEFLGCSNYHKFKTKYFVGSGNKAIPVNQSVLNMMQLDLQQYCYKIRRQDVNIGSKKIYEPRFLKMDTEYRKLYNFMESHWALNETSTEWAMVADNYLHQMCGGYPKFDKSISSTFKLDALMELLKGDLAEEKVVIWCKLRHEQAEIYQKIRRSFPATAAINGGTSISDRTRLIKSFQETQNHNILICTYGTLDFGIDLSAADTTIYYSNTWSRLKREQSEDRIVHPSKKSPLLYIDLVAEDSIDIDVLKNHTEKALRTESANDRIYASFLERLRKRQSESQSQPDSEMTKYSAKVDSWKNTITIAG